MTQSLGLVDKDFKTAIIKMFSNMQEKMQIIGE